MDELIKKSDIIILYVLFIKENGKIVIKEFLNNMKENFILINIVRGELMDLEVVIEVFESGYFVVVGIDIIEGEVNYFFKNFFDK